VHYRDVKQEVAELQDGDAPLASIGLPQPSFVDVKGLGEAA
jgi:hypothetical protein